MAFTPRLSKPEAGNKYYNTKSKGGYSDAIVGSPTDSGCNVLANCVGYAYGRFNEIGGYGYMKYLRPVNAENFIQYASGLTVGQTPQLGACMVWQKGATLSNSDGAGHVAIVEQVINANQVVTSESGWNSSAFWTKTRTKGDGNWGAGSNYKFLGFIYNPAVSSTTATTSTTTTNSTNSTVSTSTSNKTTNTGITSNMPIAKAGDKSDVVKALQILLNGYGYDVGTVDGQYGAKTRSAVLSYQRAKGLGADGVCGPKTWTSLLGL